MKAVYKSIGIILFSILLVAVLGTVAFVGLGAMLSLWLPLSLFEASALAVGATLTIAMLIHAVGTIIRFQIHNGFDEDEFDWDSSDDSDTEMIDTTNVAKVGRNAPCPCGSGKKFKNCCGNSKAP